MEKSEVIGHAWLYQLQMPNDETIVIAATSSNEAQAIAAELQECTPAEVMYLRTLQGGTKVDSKTRVRILRHKVSHLLPEYRTGAEVAKPPRPKRRKTRTVAK